MINDRRPSLALPSGAEQAYLRGEWTASHLHFKRLRASVTAKQNGFWQPLLSHPNWNSRTPRLVITRRVRCIVLRP